MLDRLSCQTWIFAVAQFSSMTAPTLCPSTLCTRRLDFRPVSPWPKGLPGVAFDGWIVSGFERDLFLNYRWDRKNPQSFTELFTAVHPHLSFAELARLCPMILDCQDINLETLTSYYGYKDKVQFSLVGEKLGQLPIEFQDWASRRRLSPMELAPLISIEVTDDLRTVVAELVQQDLTRQEGARTLELAIELILMGQAPAVVQVLKSERPFEKLQQLRNPKSTATDQNAQAWVLDQTWPRQSHIRWVRQGDQSGLEVKMIIRNPQDFEKSKDSLERIRQIFEQSPNPPWLKH